MLQGIMTNDLNSLYKTDKNAALYTLFLNVQGRILFDAYIIRPYV
jgi:folate-binding Fe-S cluster repair protein YgfZ